MEYSIIYKCCEDKMKELGISFDFKKNNHLQDATSLDDIFVNFVIHSQNRSKGNAIDIENKDKDNIELNKDILNVVKNHQYKKDIFDYLNLFKELMATDNLGTNMSLSKGKDIIFVEFAKTCQCIHEYVYQYKNVNDFIEEHKFTNDAYANWKVFKRAMDSIYNMGTALVPDFFKEQSYIEGREYLIKADIHVKRFFKNLYGKDMNEKEVYEKMMDIYNKENNKIKNDNPPYNLDKMIYEIGSKLADPNKAKDFAEYVRDQL